MKTVSLETSSELPLSELVKLAADGEPLVVTEGGEGKFLVGAVDDLELEAFALSRNAKFMAYLNKCRERGRREGGIPLEEVRRQLGLD